MIRKRKRGSGYAFQGRVNKKGMAEITRTFTTRKDAERWEREQQVAIEQCALQHKPMNLASKTLRQLIEKYRITHLPFKRGCLTEQSVLNYLCRTESFVDAPLSTLSPEIFDKDKLIKYSPVIVLVLAIAPWPSFYYWLLRIFICPISAYFAYKSYEDNNDTDLIIFSAMAILYNPN